MSLTKKLHQWQNANILSAAQAAQILAYEKKHQHIPHHWILWGLGSLGICAIILGIIALISSNWQAIPAGVKLGVNLGLYIPLIYAVKHTATRPSLGWLYHLLLLGWFGYVLATIGLIGQIFQLSGPMHQTILFWCLLTSPIILLTQRFVPLVWFSAFAFGIISWLFTLSLTQPVVTNLVFASPFLLLMLGHTLKNTLVQSLSGPLVIFGSSLLVFSWFMASLTPYAAATPIMAMAILIPTALFVHYQTQLNQTSRLFILLALVCHSCALSMVGTENIAFIKHLIAIMSVVLLSFHAAITTQKGWYNTLTLLAIAQVFIIYLQLVGSLATTGVGLILSGSSVLITIYLWHRYKSSWQKAIQTWQNH